MTQIQRILATTAKEWNLPAQVAGFCWEGPLLLQSMIFKRGDIMAPGHKTIKPLIYRIPHAAATLGVSRATLYRMIKRGELELIKIGCTRSSGITAESLDAMLKRSSSQLVVSTPTATAMGSQVGS